WYMVCIDRDENIHIMGNSKVITDKVIAKGSFTDGGWCFEAFIPWNIIIDDVYRTSEPSSDYSPDYGNYVVTVDEIISNKAQIKVGMQYDDVYNGEDGKRKDGYSYFTPPPVGRDGIPNNVIINGVDVLGIDLTVSNTCRTDGEHDFSEWIRVKAPTYYEKGKEIALCNICGTTTHREVDKLAVRFNYSDVRNGAWYYDGVLYCVQKGYMNGMSSTRFSPNTALTREQCVLILANIMGVNTDSYKDTETRFTDVPTGKWYSGAVAWATEKGYVSGITKELFGTGMNIQRAAFARLLYTAAYDMGMDMTARADLSVYADHKQIPNWAYEQISWAVANNIITSTKDDALMVSPYTTLTRAQCATMLWKLGKILDNQG
ncbi:MAG: S-layer homology domain-containing protein, partial [Clostridia bacterium]|nr:S-layer homology domain-containing protein [Clostridia bacterium]